MRVLFLFLIIFSFSCSGVRVQDVDKTEDFTLSIYKSFNFMEVTSSGDALGPNYNQNLELLKKAITRELTAKGLTLQPNQPDLLVNIGIVVTQEVQTRETSLKNPSDRTAYMGQRNYHWSSQTVEVGKYKQGAVTVHLVDRAANKLVWKASAESVVPEKEKNVPALIDEAMAKLFEKLQ